MIAILFGLKLAVKMNKTKINIFTDSLSSINSLVNTQKNLNNKYYESQILNLINSEKNKFFKIHWIPAHVGFKAHDKADLAAKLAKVDIILNKIPIEEFLVNNKNEKIQTQIKEYADDNSGKGLFYRNILNNNEQFKTWFSKNNKDSRFIKTMNRLRSGHCYDKNTLHKMKLKENNICISCNTIENAEHLILNCKTFEHVRRKYSILNGNLTYTQLLQNTDNYDDIFAYIKETCITL